MITDRNPATLENDLTPSVGWGTPTLPLLPSALASALANVEVPEWLADILGSRGATVEALAGDVWAVLPVDEGTRERITNYVLDLIKERSGELADVLIGRGGPDAIEPLLLHASARSRHSVIRAGLLRDPARLGSLRFGDLLDQRNVGPRTALEVAAILDAAGDGPGSGGTVTPAETIAPQAVPAWGEPGSPLLPIGLRRALADERLPGWVRDDLRLPPDATPASLDASVWRGVDVLPPRVRRFVLNLVAYRIDVVRDVHVVETGWPDSVDPASVPWPTRLSNALSREGLLDPGRLEATTYGDLLDLRAMGVKSALDFAAIAEVVTSGGGADVVDHTAIDGLTAAAEEEWADRLRADDPRFRDVAPVYVGSLPKGGVPRISSCGVASMIRPSGATDWRRRATASPAPTRTPHRDGRLGKRPRMLPSGRCGRPLCMYSLAVRSASADCQSCDIAGTPNRQPTTRGQPRCGRHAGRDLDHVRRADGYDTRWHLGCGGRVEGVRHEDRARTREPDDRRRHRPPVRGREVVWRVAYRPSSSHAVDKPLARAVSKMHACPDEEAGTPRGVPTARRLTFGRPTHAEPRGRPTFKQPEVRP